MDEWREHDEKLRQQRLNEAAARKSYRIKDDRLTAFK